MSKVKATKDGLDASKMTEILKYTVLNNLKLADAGKPSIALNIGGPRGIGKTGVTKAVSDELGMATHVINTAMFEPADLVGMPYKVIRMHKDGKELEVNVDLVNSFLGNGYLPVNEKVVTKFTQPHWLSDKPMILVLDDANRCRQDMMSALMELVYQGKYAEWELPKGSTVVLTSNPDNGDYLTSSEDDAMISRRMNYTMRYSVKPWLEYAESQRLPNQAISFIAKFGAEVVSHQDGDNKPDIRSWTMFFETLHSIDDYRKREVQDLVACLAGDTINPEYVMQFIQHAHSDLGELLSPIEILSRPNPEEYIESVIGGNNASSIKMLLATRFINFLKPYANDIISNKTISSNLINLMVSPKGLIPADIVTSMMIIMSRNPKLMSLTLTNVELTKKLTKL